TSLQSPAKHWRVARQNHVAEPNPIIASSAPAGRRRRLSEISERCVFWSLGKTLRVAALFTEGTDAPYHNDGSRGRSNAGEVAAERGVHAASRCDCIHA